MVNISLHSLIIAAVFIFIVFRAVRNWKDPRFGVFAFNLVIIIMTILITVLGNRVIRKHILTSEPYQPLFVSTCIVIVGFLLYRLICSQAMKGSFFYRKRSPEIRILIRDYRREIVVFTEIIATILSYSILDNLPSTNTQFLIEAAQRNSVGVFSSIMMIVIISCRFIYNLLFGNYRTVIFWFFFIFWVIFSSVLVSRELFALNVIAYIVFNEYIFTKVFTELRFYYFFASLRVSEAKFAFVIHILAAILELIASLLIISIFVNSYESIRNLQQYIV